MRSWFLARVRGSSMTPTLIEGDVLLCRARRPGSPIAPGTIAILRLPQGRPEAVKRVTGAHGDGWWVERDNPIAGVDSWLIGEIADHDVLAVVRARLYPRPRWFGA